jgi:hypothetical protein
MSIENPDHQKLFDEDIKMRRAILIYNRSLDHSDMKNANECLEFGRLVHDNSNCAIKFKAILWQAYPKVFTSGIAVATLCDYDLSTRLSRLDQAPWRVVSLDVKARSEILRYHSCLIALKTASESIGDLNIAIQRCEILLLKALYHSSNLRSDFSAQKLFDIARSEHELVCEQFRVFLDANTVL